MTDKKTVGTVTYQNADQGYFEKRGLKRHARVWSLWALGVGAVISGHFSGWNFGIGAGGWGGLFLAAIIIAVMYLGLIFSLAEMSPALPHTGGAYSFARSAMGPWGGFITGLAESIEYIMTPAVIVFFIGSYLTGIFETPAVYQPLWWIGCYLLFVTLNYVGVELSFKISVVVTVLALAVLVVFWISAIPLCRLFALGVEHRRRPGRQDRWSCRKAAAVSCRLAGRACSRHCRSRSGCSWRSKSCRWRRKSPSIPKRTCRKV